MTTTLHEARIEKPALETIQFSIGTCSLGLVLVAVSGKGICAVLLGSSKQVLLAQLRSIFPGAAFEAGRKESEEVLDAIIPHIEKPSVPMDFPLDLRGTTFQKAVWNALKNIPVGQTATYKELALKLGGTAQEIGEACGANTLAVVIPCHRVVRSDGSLAGYRWGANRKRLLLQREQELAPDPESLFAIRTH